MKMRIKIILGQYKFGRRLYSGTWYCIHPKGLSAPCFWSDKVVNSCQSEVIATEHYLAQK